MLAFIFRHAIIVKLSTAKGEAQRDSNLQPRPFRLRTLERPSNIDQVRQEVERKKKEDIESTRFKVRRKNPDEVKGYLEKCSNTAVKLNAAAILREVCENWDLLFFFLCLFFEHLPRHTSTFLFLFLFFCALSI